jgi:hypothetical protein
VAGAGKIPATASISGSPNNANLALLFIPTHP